jgi:ribose transport system ATP-binding protein
VHSVVFDEPTATLPDDEVQRLLAIIRSVAGQGIGVLYVTHRLDEVFEIADRATVLRDGRRVVTRQVADLTRLQLLHDLVGREFEETKQQVSELDAPGGTPLLHIRGLQGSRLKGVDLDVYAGELVGIAGITGSGREQLCANIFGALAAKSGLVELDGRAVPAGRPDQAMRLGAAYIPADRTTGGMCLTLSARENVTLTDLRRSRRGPFVNGAAEREEVHSWFERLDVRPRGGIENPLSSFSGGNQQKLVFAKWLRRKPKVLLLDEPTQGVDVAAKAQLHQQCITAAQEGAAVLVSSSDVDELVALSTRVLVLRRGRLVAELRGAQINAASLSRLSLLDDEDGAP